MRAVRDRPQSSRFRSLMLIALGLIFMMFVSASGAANLYTDYLWFDQLGQSSVWSGILTTKLALAAIFTTAFFLIMWTNLYLADRFAPDFRPESPEEDLIERYHQMIGSQAGRLRLIISGIFALVAGANTSSQWKTWVLFNNGEDFGVVDPLFERDASFYVFELPFWTFLVDWLFATFVFSLIITLIAHYLNGGIRASSAPAERATNGVKIHLSILLAVLAIIRAVAYFFDRFELVNARRGAYDGALATDVEVQLPALNLLVLISLFGAALFVANIWRKGWGLPVVAVGLWMVSHIIVGGIFPALYQRLRVEPVETAREERYIGDNITATRFAFGLAPERLTVQPYSYRSSLTADDVEASQTIIDDIAILDSQLADAAFKREQARLDLYDFPDRLDVDRYDVNGDLEPVVVGVRGLNPEFLGIQGWEQQRLVFTHGYGAVVAAADQKPTTGQPAYLVSASDTELILADGFEGQLEQPQVYFAEDIQGYAIVGAGRDEDSFSEQFRYDGPGGVEMGSLFRRTVFSLRFRELDVLISDFVQPESRAMYIRDVEDRVENLAPFLEFDSNPYPVLADGQVSWVIDAYTTTNKYPYSQSLDSSSLAGNADLSSGFNYVRNSVKAVVDGYTGDVVFYVVDDTDPIVNAYVKAFPDLFRPVSEAPESIASHFRYPTDIFTVQSDVWTQYHLDDPVQFLENALFWRIASQPTTSAGDSDSATDRPMEPQYRMARLPGETEEDFTIQRAFVPDSGGASTGRPTLTAVMVARSDPDQYGQIVIYDLPDGVVPAPDLADSDIREQPAVAQFVRDGNESSEVLFGEMQLVLLDDTITYIRPIYLRARTDTGVPALEQIVAVNGSRIAMAPTLDRAIEGVIVGAPATSSDADDPPVDDDSDSNDDEPFVAPDELEGLSAAELIGLANEYLDLADQAEADGDDERAREFRGSAQDVLDQLGALLGVEPPPPSTQSGEA